jgi:Response regulator containing CheY-like receiver domain and AraC-type DNA-binding domain
MNNDTVETVSTEQSTGSEERTVVVAEDESLIRMDIIETLKDNGFSVVGEAADGEKAVELARELEPDLVVMDVKMPLLDGISAAEILSNERFALWSCSRRLANGN